MISKIQSTGYKSSFKNSSENTNRELTEYKKNFFAEQAEKEYQKDLKTFNRSNILTTLFALGWAAYDYNKGDKSGAKFMLIIAAVLFPITYLFRPKKEKYDIKAREELNKTI